MRTIKAIIIAIGCVFLTTACSKKIMPPEIEIAGSVSEETNFTTSSLPNDLGGTGGSVDDGFFSEEPVLESGSMLLVAPVFLREQMNQSDHLTIIRLTENLVHLTENLVHQNQAFRNLDCDHSRLRPI